MKARDALLIATHLTADDFRGELLEKTRSRVKQAIGTARELGLNPIVVLGPSGDDFLRSCPELEDCDLAYDPNFNGGLFSGVHAGAHAATGACFVLPIDVDGADRTVWRALDAAAWALMPGDAVHVLFQAAAGSDGGAPPVFPQLITRDGVKLLRTLPPETAWREGGGIRFQVLRDTLEPKSPISA